MSRLGCLWKVFVFFLLVMFVGCATIDGTWESVRCVPYPCLEKAVMLYGQQCQIGYDDPAIYISFGSMGAHVDVVDDGDAIYKLTPRGAFRRINLHR